MCLFYPRALLFLYKWNWRNDVLSGTALAGEISHLSCSLVDCKSLLGKCSAFWGGVFCSFTSCLKNMFGNHRITESPSYAALGRKEPGVCDVVSPWLKYSLVTRKMSDWDRVSKFSSAAEITEGLIISIFDAVK